jgi:hypothetical protein
LHICFSCGDQYHMSRNCPTNSIANMKNLEKKACSHCGEEGHPANKCPGNCPNCGAIHSIKDCTTRLVSCYLCESNDHTPNKCPMDFLVTSIASIQQGSFCIASQTFTRGGQEMKSEIMKTLIDEKSKKCKQDQLKDWR